MAGNLAQIMQCSIFFWGAGRVTDAACATTAAPARAAAQEGAVEDIFQSAHLLADRGLSAPQGLGGAAHAAGADGGDEAAQGGGVDISRHKAIL